MTKAMFLIAALLVAPAWAVNKCTGADGKVTYQDAACPISAKDGQQVKTWTTGGYGATAVSTGRRDVTPNPALNGPPEAAPLLALYRRWADAERLAFATSRIALSGPAAGMQALQREAEATKVPECLTAAHKTLTELITKSSEAILEFMARQEVTSMAYQLVHKPKLVPQFESAVTSAMCK